jgi:hypothetical protein
MLVQFFNLFQAMNCGEGNRFNSLNLCIPVAVFNIRKVMLNQSLVFQEHISSFYTVVFIKYNSNSEGK